MYLNFSVPVTFQLFPYEQYGGHWDDLYEVYDCSAAVSVGPVAHHPSWSGL